MDCLGQSHQIPQEIIDIIIDDNSHNAETYRKFALVSKSCLHSSRKHLFRSIWLEGDDGVCRTLSSRFWKILRANTAIAGYVREVRIKDFSPFSHWFGDNKDQERRTSWIREEETFHNIVLVLAKSGQITDLSLETDLDWTSFPIGLQHALTQILNAPSLMNLELSLITSLPISCCTGFVRLKHMHISDVTLADSGGYHEKGAKTVSISSLNITRVKGKSAQLLRNILALSDTASPRAALEKLRVSSCDASFTREVIQASRKSLRCLTLESDSFPTYSSETGSVKICDLDSLNRLEIVVFGPNVDPRWWQNDIISLLETGGPNEELRTIYMSFYNGRNWVDPLSHPATAEFWRRLSTTLDRFPSVVDVVIKLVLYLRRAPQEVRARMARDICSALGSDGGTIGSVNRVLRVEISEW